MSETNTLFSGFSDWINIFRTGTHTSAEGREVTIVESDLDEMIENFSDADSFPFVLGHPAHDAPAYGWSAGLKKETLPDGEIGLFTASRDVHQAFEAGVKSGAYRNRSISAGRDKEKGWFINHLGWLGATMPAVDGLVPVNFNNDSLVNLYQFSSGDDAVGSAIRRNGWTWATVKRILRNHKNSLIASEGVEKADQVLPEHELDQIGDTAESQTSFKPASEQAHMYSSARLQQPHTTTVGGDTMGQKAGDNKGGNNDDAVTFSQADLDAAVLAATGTATAAATAAANLEAEALKFSSTLVAEGKLPPALEQGFAQFMQSLDDEQCTLTFAAADGAESSQEKLSPLEFCKQLMSMQSMDFSKLSGTMATDDNAPDAEQSADFSRPAGTAVDTDNLAIHNKALEFQRANPGTDYLVAVNEVS